MQHRTAKGHYGYAIKPERIAPLAGGRYHYAARVVRLVRYNDTTPDVQAGVESPAIRAPGMAPQDRPHCVPAMPD